MDTATANSFRACGECCTKIVNLSVTINGRNIIKNINIHMHCGEMTIIIGPNGAGKTTLLKAILGEIPYEGEVRFFDPHKNLLIKPSIGYVPQRLDFDSEIPFTVSDLFYAASKRWPAFMTETNKKIALGNLAKFGVDHLSKQKLNELSGGEIQRVLLSLAIEPPPALLLLDEPLSHVDRNGMILFFEIVSELRREKDISVLLVSHDLPLSAKYADRIILLDEEILAAGTPLEVLSSSYAVDLFGKINLPEIKDKGNDYLSGKKAYMHD